MKLTLHSATCTSTTEQTDLLSYNLIPGSLCINIKSRKYVINNDKYDFILKFDQDDQTEWYYVKLCENVPEYTIDNVYTTNSNPKPNSELQFYFSLILYNIKQLIESKISMGKNIENIIDTLSVLPNTYEKLFK